MKNYIIKNPGKMYINITNLLLGASMAMNTSTGKRFKLHATFANNEAIRFQTNCDNFASRFRVHLSNYDLTVEEERN